MLRRLRDWARRLRRDVHALWRAARDPRTPWTARAVALLVAAYALSPIDLVPDFIPVLGLLDDLLLVPLGIALAARLLPPALLAEHRAAADAAAAAPRPPWATRLGLALVLALWAALAALAVRLLARG